MRRILILWSLWLGSTFFAAAAAAIDIGSRLELLVDDYLIEKISGGARLELHHPVRRNVALVTDRAWEGNACHYRTVFQDGDRYRMYYGAYQYDVSATGQTYPHEAFLCYAESRDGIHFERPNLGLVEFRGSRSNNIVLTEKTLASIEADPGHAAIFKDENPETPADARYKMIIRSNGEKGLLALKSPDGIRFTALTDRVVISEGAFDSQNLAFWDPHQGQYRAYFRGFKEKVRDILTATSPDFLNWTKPVWLEYPEAPREHLYTNQLRPYYRAPHILIGFPMRYTDRGRTESTWRLPGAEVRQHRAQVSHRYGTTVTDALLMTGRDRLSFKRWGEAFIRPGASRINSWVYGDNSIAWGIVETDSDLPESPRELSIYVVEGYWTASSLNVRRYSIRMDGFVSLQAPLSGGEMVTKPLRFQGNKLLLNYSSSGGGGLWVELQNEQGRPIKGFTQADADEVFGDHIEGSVSWKGSQDVSSLAGKPVRIRFILKDADLYSFRFSGKLK